MKCGSLFAGIGGFDLGLERAGIKIIWQVEIDEYCRRVLAKHFPDAERFGDVRECGAHNLKPVDIICGGFPCQDISVAGAKWGERTGLEGDCSGLWWEMLRIVRVVRPQFVVMENVAAILGNGLGDVLAGLAESGYDAEWDCLPASAFGAPHQRDRCFMVANSRGIRMERCCAETIPRFPGFSWNVHVRRVEDVRQRPDLPEPLLWGTGNGIPNRVDRIRSLGNAVVPQVAEWIGRQIVKVHSNG